MYPRVIRLPIHTLPHSELEDFPTAALLAPEDKVIFPVYLGGDMIGHHGGITPQELPIPLLVASNPG